MFERLQRLSLAYHGRHPLGDLLQRLSGDVFVIYFAVSQVALPATISLLFLVGMFAIMASLDVTLALIAFAVVPLLAVSLLLFTKPMDVTTTRQYETQGALMALAEQSLSAIKVIQGFAREAYMQRKLDERAQALGRAYNVAIRVSGGYKEVTALIMGTAAALLLGVGGARVLAGQLSLGDLLVFLGYLAALYGPVSELSLSVSYAVQVVARGRRMFEVIDSEEEVPERHDALDLNRARGEVEFEDVTFGYRGYDSEAPPRPILHNVSFRARPGQITAIVGATGAGKSSLVSLLSRFYDPWEGRIVVDGHNVRDLSLRSLRENVSLVLQEPFLFHMSAADNIAFGRPEATRAEIVAAARATHAHEFIERLPQGYDTVIEEKGGSLSGGERQRIGIARALLKDAPILILDEPTSALDASTEAQIFAALSSLMQNKTTFIISHRLSTIRRAEQVLVLEDGCIVERGTHESLLAKGNVYAGLYKHQHLSSV
jgi:ABC-type multidrug transport system fused ATPase/permease subunit